VKRLVLLGILVLVLLMLPVAAAACGGTATTTTAAPTGSTAATTATTAGSTATTAASTETSAAAATDTIKIGAVVWLGWPLGLDMKKGIDVMVALDNANGGIDIGGKKYKVELVTLESNNDQAQTMAAVNKLIYEEKVKFLITDSMYIGSVLAETEKNKVVCVHGSPIPAGFDPNFKYAFSGGFMFQATPEVAGWMAKNVDFKDAILAHPDDAGGEAYAMGAKATLERWGMTIKAIKYPAASTDLSSIGTEVVTAKPSGFIALGSTAMDPLVYQAVTQAGFKGQLFNTATITVSMLTSATPAEKLEGMIAGAWPVEFDPAVTDVAKAFKAKYIEMYGKWDGPEIQLTGAYAALRAALEKAGQVDSDAVANALASGLTFEGPTGKGEMIPRNDLGITRSVDSISEFCVKVIKNGQPVLLHQITLDEGKSYLDPAILGTTATTAK
jgi:branched-chain amino acid transport system substrate-binding protein